MKVNSKAVQDIDVRCEVGEESRSNVQQAQESQRGDNDAVEIAEVENACTAKIPETSSCPSLLQLARALATATGLVVQRAVQEVAARPGGRSARDCGDARAKWGGVRPAAAHPEGEHAVEHCASATGHVEHRPEKVR